MNVYVCKKEREKRERKCERIKFDDLFIYCDEGTEAGKKRGRVGRELVSIVGSLRDTYPVD